MDKKSDYQFIVMQVTIEYNKQKRKTNTQDSDEKMMKLIRDIKSMLAEITDHINALKSSPTQKGSPNPPDPNNVVSANRRAPPLYVG